MIETRTKIAKLKLSRPTAIDERTIDNLIRILAAREGVPVVEAARELLAGLAAWFGVDFQREARQAAGEEDES